MADKQPPKTKKYYRSTKSGAGMTQAGVKDCCYWQGKKR